ncbi:hypothetical protein LSAT2_002880 [Lamellibrachia satsuma]|nr:hypothetical protein LSAT2_002880 [Lamellibrachia satsuma]
MNVPGQRKHPSQVQVQPQPQPRGSYHGYPQGPTPPVNYNRTGQPEGFENQSGRQIYRQPPQQYLQGFHQSGVPPHDMSKQSMSAQVPPPPGQTPPQATGVQMMYPNVTQQVPRNAGYVQQRQNMQGMGQRPPVPVAMMTTSNTVYNPQQMTTAVYLPPSIQQQTQFMTGQPQVLNYMTGPGGQMQMQYQAQMPPYTIQRAPQSAQYNAATYYQQQPTANNTLVAAVCVRSVSRTLCQAPLKLSVQRLNFTRRPVDITICASLIISLL